MSGKLVLVGTPIGNMGDLSPRAVELLQRADLIACEDTRRTGQLLARIGTAPGRDRAPLVALHEHNERERVEMLVARMSAGQTVALVSDAGMPGVSDPGEHVVAAAIEAGIVVDTVPGPTAAITALVMSGISPGRFCFEGFLPRKGSARASRLAELHGERRTVVLYEAPHRLERTLTDMAAALGSDRRVALGRELTKLHEEMWRGTIAEALHHVASVDPRGEFVVVVEGADAPGPADDDAIETELRAHLDAGASTRDAVAAVVADLGVAKRRVYALAVELQR
jgi:16S rRNA (cytidine1402-2'-O)-methyltransferase